MDEAGRVEIMQVILPVAGRGTRMRPHTHTDPKPLLRVAGKRVIDYILDELKELDFVEDITFITGYKGQKFKEYVTEQYDFEMHFEEQTTLDGSSGAIKLAEPHIHDDVLVIFTDTVFDLDLTVIPEVKADGIIWGKKVEDYSRFGIMLTDEQGYLTQMKEKPDKPYTRLANIGVYYVKNHELMYDCIHEQYDKDLKHKGEYNFPEALGMMADRGEKIKVMEADGWYDTGKPETTLASQAELLKKRHHARRAEESEIVGNVYIDDTATVKNCTIGPNVSVSENTVVENCQLENCVIGANSTLEDCELLDSLVGDHVTLKGVTGEVNVGDHSQIRHEDTA